MLTRTWNFNHAHANLEAEPPWAWIALRQISRARHPSPKQINEMPEPLRRLFVGQRHGRIKKELGIDVGDALAYDFADTIAVTPPLFRIIIRVGDWRRGWVRRLGCGPTFSYCGTKLRHYVRSEPPPLFCLLPAPPPSTHRKGVRL